MRRLRFYFYIGCLPLLATACDSGADPPASCSLTGDSPTPVPALATFLVMARCPDRTFSGGAFYYFNGPGHTSPKLITINLITADKAITTFEAWLPGGASAGVPPPGSYTVGSRYDYNVFFGHTSFVNREAGDLLSGRLEIDSLAGNVLYGRFDVRFRDARGEQRLVGRLSASYNPAGHL